MILADTSVWINHFHSRSDRLCRLLEEDRVLVHPFVIGELACGRLRNRAEALSHLQALPQAPKADDGEVLHFIEAHDLAGKGLGLIDTHLLASAHLAHCRLWTADRRLRRVAEAQGICIEEA